MATSADFIAQFGSATFRHSHELLDGLRSGSIEFDSASFESRQLCSSYLDLYQFRLTHIRERSQSAHGQAIAADIEALCDGLSLHPDSPCDLWLFRRLPVMYSVFVARVPHVISGCIRGVDARELSEAELAQLWGRT